MSVLWHRKDLQPHDAHWVGKVRVLLRNFDMSSRVQAVIYRRADELQCNGSYWCFASWLAWGYSQKTQVCMLLGAHKLHILVLAPGVLGRLLDLT